MKKRKLDIKKRTHCYVMAPAAYGLPPCKCGNKNIQWSEYEHRLWCDRCNLDFIPKHNGIFGGPIPITVTKMLGISFDRINLKTMKVEKFIC